MTALVATLTAAVRIPLGERRQQVRLTFHHKHSKQKRNKKAPHFFMEEDEKARKKSELYAWQSFHENKTTLFFFQRFNPEKEEPIFDQ